ncbi:MAG: hypothetical protein ACREC0_00515 [Methylocella sp.]
MTEPRILGIDIGSAGALALITTGGALIEVADMPVLRGGPKNRAAVNGPLLAEIVYRWHATQAFSEHVSARPGEGAVRAFAFGHSKGCHRRRLGRVRRLLQVYHASVMEARRGLVAREQGRGEI